MKLVLFMLIATSVYSRPVILVHGWGNRVVTNMDRIEQYLMEDGLYSSHIFQPRYPFRRSPDVINQVLGPKIKSFMDRFPDAEFDIVTHSLGHFAALYTLVKSGLSHRVKNYIGLGGVAYGQDLGLFFTTFGGATARKIMPYRNDWLMSFMREHSQEIAAMHKCSLYSTSDRYLNPIDAGAFEDGFNIELDGVTHWSFLWSRKAYNEMKNCLF